MHYYSNDYPFMEDKTDGTRSAYGKKHNAYMIFTEET
jgi:hypothetical protein